jgi:hypothetical protein
MLVVGYRESEQVVELGDETLHSRNELDEALRNQHGTEVVAVLGTLGDSSGNLSTIWLSVISFFSTSSETMQILG